MAIEDLIEVKFRLADGTDIGPSKYSPATSVASLKGKILTQWPKGLQMFFFLHPLICVFVLFSINLCLFALVNNLGAFTISETDSICYSNSFILESFLIDRASHSALKRKGFLFFSSFF